MIVASSNQSLLQGVFNGAALNAATTLTPDQQRIVDTLRSKGVNFDDQNWWNALTYWVGAGWWTKMLDDVLAEAIGRTFSVFAFLPTASQIFDTQVLLNMGVRDSKLGKFTMQNLTQRFDIDTPQNVAGSWTQYDWETLKGVLRRSSKSFVLPPLPQPPPTPVADQAKVVEQAAKLAKKTKKKVVVPPSASPAKQHSKRQASAALLKARADLKKAQEAARAAGRVPSPEPPKPKPIEEKETVIVVDPDGKIEEKEAKEKDGKIEQEPVGWSNTMKIGVAAGALAVVGGLLYFVMGRKK